MRLLFVCQSSLSLLVFPKGIIRHWLAAKLIHRIFLYLCLFALTLPGNINAETISGDTQTILVLGDSLSAGYGIKKEEGWVALLEQKLKTEGYAYRLVNASISGETTGGGLSRLSGLLTQYHPDLLLIELGANDGLRGFPIKVLNNNLDTMIALGKKNRSQVLLIGIQLPLNYGPHYTDLFEKTFVICKLQINIQQKISGGISNEYV